MLAVIFNVQRSPCLRASGPTRRTTTSTAVTIEAVVVFAKKASIRIGPAQAVP